MGSLSRDFQQVLRNVSLLAGMVALSVALYSLQSWLEARGGWALLFIGTLCLWSALLAALTVVREQRRRRQERAINEALAEVRRAIASAPAQGQDEREGQ